VKTKSPVLPGFLNLTQVNQMKIKLSEARKINRGLWIPQFILEDTKLTFREQYIYALIFNYDNKNGCFISNKGLSEYFGMKKHSVQNILDSLAKKKYIKRIIKTRPDGSYIKRIIIIVERNVEVKGRSFEDIIDEEKIEQEEFRKTFFETNII